VNQILEDMLRACALQYGRSWDKSLPYAEFSYNNSYQESLKMAPYEMLYGRRCWTPLFWNEMGERKVFRPAYWKKQRSKFIWLRKSFVSRNRDKRATPTMEERTKLRSGRFCLPQGVTYERFASFQGSRQACP
jgi:hypothetical protein